MKIEVDKDFILRAYNEACPVCKSLIERELPQLFTVNIREIQFNHKKEITIETSYKFSIGDLIIVVDGSYNVDFKGIKRNGMDPLFKNHKAVIVDFTNEVFVDDCIGGRVSVNLLIEMDDANKTRLYCAPICVNKIA